MRWHGPHPRPAGIRTPESRGETSLLRREISLRHAVAVESRGYFKPRARSAAKPVPRGLNPKGKLR
jgi:hypothetical protein